MAHRRPFITRKLGVMKSERNLYIYHFTMCRKFLRAFWPNPPSHISWLAESLFFPKTIYAPVHQEGRGLLTPIRQGIYGWHKPRHPRIPLASFPPLRLPTGSASHGLGGGNSETFRQVGKNKYRGVRINFPQLVIRQWAMPKKINTFHKIYAILF